MADEHAGHRKRLRERFITQGLDGFAPHEVLELLLCFAIPRKNVNPLAHELLNAFGSLHGVLDASPEELMQVEGVGENAAVLLNLVSQTARRVELSREIDLERMDNRLKCELHCKRLMSGLKEEHFYAICLDGQMRIIRDVLIARGTISEVPAYPRLVVQAALRHNAHAVVLCHNHPGGQLAPSQADLDATEALARALSGVGITLADHVIVSGGRTLSMVAEKMIVHTVPAETPQAASSAGQVRIAHGMTKTEKE